MPLNVSANFDMSSAVGRKSLYSRPMVDNLSMTSGKYFLNA